MEARIAFFIHGLLAKPEKFKQQVLTVFDAKKVGFFQTDSQGISDELIAEATNQKANYFIAVGGDGTLNALVNALMRQAETARVALGVLPYGTGNDFARFLRISKDLKALKLAIQSQSILTVDVGLMQFVNHEGHMAQRYFINIADVGLGGLVSSYVSQSKRKWGAELTYLKAIVRGFINYRHVEVHLRTPEFSWKGPVMAVVWANGRFFGNGLCVAPEAKLDDAKAEMIIIGAVSLWDYLKNVINLKRGIKIKHTDVHYHQCSECELTSAQPMPIDMDGESIGFGPLRMQILANQLQIIDSGL
jgi:diacylglycerol kinase (ATP)